MTEELEVLIRFNTDYRSDNRFSKEWRVLVNRKEKLCNNVIVKCSSRTSKNFIEGVGDKWHIKCDATALEFIEDGHHNDGINFQEIIIS